MWCQERSDTPAIYRLNTEYQHCEPPEVENIVFLIISFPPDPSTPLKIDISRQTVLQILDKLEKSVIIDEVLPLLCEIRLTDLTILTTVLGMAGDDDDDDTKEECVEMYRVMLSDRKYGLTMTVLATRVLPVLIPQMVNTQLDMETYISVQSTIQEMLDHIDR